MAEQKNSMTEQDHLEVQLKKDTFLSNILSMAEKRKDKT